jgi:histidinol-phosphatase
MVMSKEALDERLVFAQKIARELATYQMSVVKANLTLERKEDGTPVTQVDQESERRFREAVAYMFPGDVILGEEEGGGQSATRWVIDPIDGTRKFMRGLPFWGICIAFELEAELELAVVAVPGNELFYSARRGGGAFRNGEKIFVDNHEISDLGEAFMTMPSRECFLDSGYEAAYDLTQRCIEHDPGFLDAYSYGLVADGRIHGVLSTMDKWWDIAAPVLIVREAGGVFVDVVDGKEPKADSLNLAGSPFLVESLLPRLQESL